MGRAALAWLAVVGCVALASGEERTVRVGVYENQPTVFFDQAGRPQGIYVDILERIARSEGWRLDYVAGTWPECLDRLERGEIDLLVAIAFAEERLQRFDFTDETVLSNWGTIYARASSAIQSFLDLRDRTVAGVPGDIYFQTLKGLLKHFGVECRFVEVAEYEGAIRAIEEGRADAAVTNRLIGRVLERRHKVARTPILFKPIELRFGLPKGKNADLAAAIDRHLRAMKADSRSAYYQALDRWLGGVARPGAPRWLTWVLAMALGLLAVAVAFGVLLGKMVRRRTDALRLANQELRRRLAEVEEAHARLEEAESEKGLILESVDEHVIYHSLGLRIRWANRAAGESLGLEPQALVGKSCFELWHGRQSPCPDCPVLEAMRTREPTQGEAATPDGRRWHIRAYPVAGEDGELVGVVEITRDITAQRMAEEAARASEEKFRKAFESCPDPMVISVVEDGRILDVSRSFEELAGYSREEAIGRTTLELGLWVEPRDRDRFVRAVVREGRVRDLEARFRVKDGQEEIGLVSAEQIVLAGKRCVLSSVKIITERKRAEEALRESRERYANLFNGSNDAIFVHDLEGNILDVNEKVLTLFGYSRREVLSLNIADLHPTGALERSREAFAAIQRDGVVRFEVDFRKKDGEVFPAEVSASVFTVGGERLVQGIVRDITERREAERALRESEAKFRTLIETIPHCVTIFQDNRNVYINPAGLRMFRCTDPGQIVGHDVMERVADCDKERLTRYVSARGNGGGVPDHYYATFKRLDGEEFPAEVYVRPTVFNGRPAWQVMAIDITERRRAEEELRQYRERLEELVEQRTAELAEVNAELEAFAYSVSHDLRAPLRAMEGFAEALLEDYSDRLDEEGRDYARSIAEAAKRMDRLVCDLLAYSRIGRREIHLDHVDLEAVVEDLLVTLESEISRRGATVEVARPMPRVRAHYATLAQVVGNLLSNALKFVEPPAAPRVKVWAEEDGEMVRLWVEDNGIGIAPEHQERIFRVFERLHGVDKYPGTGIGLAIVRRGAERMGGRVGVQSEPGRGSRFFVELPRAGGQA